MEETDSPMAILDAHEPKIPGNDEDSIFGAGWIDYIYTNTTHFANMLQWGDKTEVYSLSNDMRMAKGMYDSMQKKIKRSLSHSLGIEGNNGSDDSSTYTFNGNVADTTLYSRLNVPPDATKSRIKSSYYKLALKYHPDKNPSAEAKRKFQEIGEAYQILSDDSTRAMYDKHGTKVTQDIPMIDHSLFFMMLFGCEQLEDYIGTLKIASFIQYASSDALKRKLVLSNRLDVEQNYRETHLAVLLKDRLDPYLKDGDWSQSFKDDLVNLCNGTFGDTLVESIGWVYENCADGYIAEATTFWGLGATYSNIQAAGRNINNTWSMAKSVINVALVVKDLKDSSDINNGTINQQDAFEKVKDIITNALSLVLYDVETTVRVAASKVCRDQDVDVDERLKRAEGIRQLGILMQEIAQKSREGKDNTPDISRQMQEAFVKAVQRRDDTK